MVNIPGEFKIEKIIWNKTLNTFQLWVWLHNWEPLSSICTKQINWSEIDTSEGLKNVLSLENRKDAWWEKYRETNPIITTRLNWTKDEILLPSIWWGWMWMDISSLSLNEATSYEATSGNWYFMTSHISSIWIGNFIWPDFFENKWEWFELHWNRVEKIFFNLFENLWLIREQIEVEFLKVDDNLNLDPKNFKIDLKEPKKNRKTYLDSSFQPNNREWRLVLMKDLIELYKNIIKAKDSWLFVPINHMYKATWYVASIKVAALAWADAITTGAWIPRTWYSENNNVYVQPRDIVTEFYKSIWRGDLKMPAFWLIVSMTMAYSPWFDYYINEDPRNAWGHQWATESILQYEKRISKQSVLKSLKKRGWIENTPIYAGGWINSAADIKEMFEMWFDWIQLWTSFAVSKEARNHEWDDFKKALISWNHFWPETKIDNIASEAANILEKNIETEIEIFRKKFENILGINLDKWLLIHNISWYLKHAYNLEEDLWISYQDAVDVINLIENKIFNNGDIKNEFLSDTKYSLYESILEELELKYNWDIKKLRKELRLYWNLLKAKKEFKKLWELWKIPTHLLFDSVVWFIWRMRIEWWEHRLLNWSVMKAIKCIQCVTSCLLTNTWWVTEEQWSKFCIRNSLDIWKRDRNKDLIVNFTWTTTAFYPEIRPVKDIISAFVWTEVIR